MESGQYEEEDDDDDDDDDDYEGGGGEEEEEKEKEEDKSFPLLGPFSGVIYGDTTDVYLDTQALWHITPYLRAEEVKRLR